MKKKNLFISLITFSTVLIYECAVFAATKSFSNIDKGGEKILDIVRHLGYWIILIKGLTEIVKAGLEGDNRAVGKIMIQYILIYASLYFLPWMLREVEGIFK